MLKKDKMGLRFEDYPEHKIFIEKLGKIGYALDGCIPFIRHTSFIPDGKPKCDICGSTELIHGVGRYIICDVDNEWIDDEEDRNSVEIYLCGYCQDRLSTKWKIDMDFG